MKVLAFYLPQFHEIPENNEWWGKGFTEWVNVKKAAPLFKNHYQPKIPLNNNYYSLDDIKTMEWQCDLAKSYKIDGFCFYHYWFNGKLLLQKPLEMYRESDINFQYCFSWANEPWTRSWDGKNKAILIEQKYNGEEDIINHWNYMINYFKDPRYIKLDNRPVFFIYRCNNISYLEEMIEVWNKKAKLEGFEGIYFIETLTGFQKTKFSENTQATVYMEPMYCIGKRSKLGKLITAWRDIFNLNRRENYKNVWNRCLKLEKLCSTSNAGAFVDWDNSARKKTKNLVLTNSSPEIFTEMFRKQYNSAMKSNCEFLLINAWNEWAEGTYLEPDSKNEYKFLEGIKSVIDNFSKE